MANLIDGGSLGQHIQAFQDGAISALGNALVGGRVQEAALDVILRGMFCGIYQPECQTLCTAAF